MASEDIHDVTLGSDGSNDAMRKKLLGILSRLNEHMSPDVKSHFTNMMRQYKELDDSERKDFDENMKRQLTGRIANAARNQYISEMMSSVLVVVCGATVFLLFGMNPMFQFL
jgi:t-SNARE complex subunit (syntaxin)